MYMDVSTPREQYGGTTSSYSRRTCNLVRCSSVQNIRLCLGTKHRAYNALRDVYTLAKRGGGSVPLVGDSKHGHFILSFVVRVLTLLLHPQMIVHPGIIAPARDLAKVR